MPASFTRRWLCGLGLLGGGFYAFAGEALRTSPSGRRILIGILSTGEVEAKTNGIILAKLKAALPEFAERLLIAQRDAGFSKERLAGQVDELLRLGVDVLICLDLTAALAFAARRQRANPPMVFMAHDDPLACNLIQSYAKPGNNLTGVTTFRCVDGKMVEIISAAFPTRRRVGYFLDSTVNDNACIRLADEAAARLAIQLIKIDAAERHFMSEIGEHLRALRLQAAIAPSSTPLWQNRRLVVGSLNDLKIPVIYESAVFLSEGGLMFYGPVRTDAIAQIATDVHKILRGEPAGEIPVDQPTLFELVINLGAPHAMDYQISAATLQRADQILQ
jgi:putative tryptophan/tyrosine transport system substrate-binding protein